MIKPPQEISLGGFPLRPSICTTNELFQLLGLYLRLTPANPETVTAVFDNIHIIEWASPVAQHNYVYHYALLTGSGKLTFTQQILAGVEQ